MSSLFLSGSPFRKKILIHPKSAQINLVAVQNNQIVGFCDAGVAFIFLYNQEKTPQILAE